MKRSLMVLPALILIINILPCTNPVFAATGGGDQILDGIGETAMIARYIFNGNAQDRSRNTYHATLHGSRASYVEDSQFGQVLSLPGGNSGNYVQIPGQALNGVDTISVTGWIYLRDTIDDQRFFDFGRNATDYFFCSPVGLIDPRGYRARITTSGQPGQQGPQAQEIPIERWVHLAVVLDATAQTLSIYQDGIRVGQAANVNLSLDDILNQNNAASNLLYIGKSQGNYPELNAKLHDVRLYSIALTDQQVATIRNNALSDEVKVKSDLAAINLGNLTNRITDIALPTEGASGSYITWESNLSDFVTLAGTVTRPPSSYAQPQVTVTLTATAILNNASGKRTFIITVPRMPPDKEVVASDKAALNLANLSALKADLTLPTSGPGGSSITWTSNNENAISAYGKVTRSPAPAMQRLSWQLP